MPNGNHDLNLFRVFDAVMRHGSLKAAGREIGITASAVSHALTRLRAVAGDDLFVATRRGVAPTPRAIAYAPQVAAALAALAEMTTQKPFDPATTAATIRIGVSDYIGGVMLPPLVRRLLAQAPNLRLRVEPIGRVDLVTQLDEGRLDLIMSWFAQTPRRIRRRVLFREQEALVTRPGHRLAARRPTLRELLAAPHLVVELTGSDDLANDGLQEERGVQRRVWIDRLLLDNGMTKDPLYAAAVTVPTYDIVPAMLAGTDLVAALPLRLARDGERREQLVRLDLPYAPLQMTTEIAWHERADGDPTVEWLLERIAEVAQEADAAAGLSTVQALIA